MSGAVDTAMVLAAGLGTRMRPLTEDRPKPLIEVAGRALLDHALDELAASGVRRAVVNVHYLADMTEAHVAARSDLDILISDERNELMETGGGLAKARPLLGDGPVLCTNTDQVFVSTPEERPAARLKAAFDADSMDALLLLQRREETSGYDGPGDFDLDDKNRLVRRGEAASAPYVFTGVQIIDTRLLDGAPAGPFSTNVLWNKALERGRLFGIVHEGAWMHVGSPAGLKDAEARLAALRDDRRN
ncbi:MAG: nucleotidyltransferase family protein [Pseudomonadota bacterium]